MKRTHTCGELGIKNLDKKIALCGWVHTRRDHGGIIFIDLRDRYGLTQVVFDPSYNANAHKMAEELGRVDVNEDIRLKYRYLDLRKPSMQRNIAVRHKVMRTAREYFDSHGFLEIETPILAKSTPEGARDY